MASVKQLDPSICDVQIKQGAVVCIEGEYIGNITIGARTVIHPTAHILAEAGPIIIGDGNLIEEQVYIVNRLPEGSDKKEEYSLVIGNDNVFEVGSYCEAKKVGDNNVLEIKSYVGPNVELTRGCIIGALCKVNCPEVLPENTVIYGDDHHRRTQLEKRIPQTLQLDSLMKMLPNYHHLVKAKRKSKPAD